MLFGLCSIGLKRRQCANSQGTSKTRQDRAAMEEATAPQRLGLGVRHQPGWYCFKVIAAVKMMGPLCAMGNSSSTIMTVHDTMHVGACSVAVSYKAPMLVTRARLPACAPIFDLQNTTADPHGAHVAARQRISPLAL